jgi:hypothetical protein
MQKPRRALLMAAAAGIAGALTRPLGLTALQTPQPLPSPNAPRNPNAPAGMDGPEIIKPSKVPPNPINQMQIAALVQQLYKLTGELKEEVDHTDLNSTFALSVVKKAHDIEKLAKQIKERAKG